jgi:uncharacterized protein YqgV (UPF0045/DUF77 family)
MDTVCLGVIPPEPLFDDNNSAGTNVEGPWSQVMDAIKACHEAVHAMGTPRIAVSPLAALKSKHN